MLVISGLLIIVQLPNDYILSGNIRLVYLANMTSSRKYGAQSAFLITQILDPENE